MSHSTMDNFLPFLFTIRVYAEDTDLMGIVYHANYLCYFERARTEFLRAQGWSLTQLARIEYHFAIYQVTIKYLKPARLDDELCINTVVDEKRSCSLSFKQAITNQNGEILVEAQITVACVDKQLKPKRLPALPILNNKHKTKGC